MGWSDSFFDNDPEVRDTVSTHKVKEMIEAALEEERARLAALVLESVDDVTDYDSRTAIKRIAHRIARSSG